MKKFYNPQSFLFLLFFAIGLAHCAKTKENIERNIVIDAVTSGHWLVKVLTENGVDVSGEFSAYEFQFYENGTLQAIKGSEITNGTWVADIDAHTIYSNFPVANDTLLRLNDTWKIKNSTLTLVEANPVNTSRIAYLKLVKK